MQWRVESYKHMCYQWAAAYEIYILLIHILSIAAVFHTEFEHHLDKSISLRW